MNDDTDPKREDTSWLKRLTHLFSHKPHSADELIAILRHCQREDIIDADSLRMIEGVLQVSNMPVSEIMISRAEMSVVQKDMSFEEILEIVSKSTHSRFPVIGENKDEVIGIMLAKDLLAQSRLTDKNQRFIIKDIVRSAMFIPESKRLGVLLNEFRKRRNHLAIVVDEYGGVNGLVTIEDVLEQIVGDIEDEYDIDQGIFIRQHKGNTYSVKALTPIEDFNHFFNTTFSDEEFDTIGGLVLKGFGHLPKRGESLVLNGMRFTVLRANSRRIQLLQAELPIPPQEATEP